MHSSRMRTACSSSHRGAGVGGIFTRHPSVMAFWCGAFWCGGLLLWPSGVVPSVMAFWCGGLLVWCLLLWSSGVVPSGMVAFCYGLLVWWPSGVVPSVMAFCPRRPYQKATFNQRAPHQKAKTEDHNRRP